MATYIAVGEKKRIYESRGTVSSDLRAHINAYRHIAFFGLRRPSGGHPGGLRGSLRGANTPATRVALRATCLRAPGAFRATDAGTLLNVPLRTSLLQGPNEFTAPTFAYGPLSPKGSWDSRTLFHPITDSCTSTPLLECLEITGSPIIPLRGTIVNRTCGIYKNLYIQSFLLTIFGPIN